MQLASCDIYDLAGFKIQKIAQYSLDERNNTYNNILIEYYD